VDSDLCGRWGGRFSAH